MSIIWAFQNSDTITKQNWDMHAIWILIWFYLFLVLALLMLLFSFPSSFCSYFPMNGISCECFCCFHQPNMKPEEIHISVTSLRLLDIYSSAATSELSTDYLKTCSWSSRQIGKRALSDGYCCVSWHFQYHMPWFLLTAMQRFEAVFAKAAICLYFRSNTLREVFALMCRLRPGLPALLRSEQKVHSASAAGSSCRFRVIRGSLVLQDQVCRSSAVSPRPFGRRLRPLTQRQADLSSSASWRIWSWTSFIKSVRLKISEGKLKSAQGQSANRKQGLNVPKKLFADWIITGKYRVHLEGLDLVCQIPLDSEATSETAFSQVSFRYVTRAELPFGTRREFKFLVPDPSQYLKVEGKPQEKFCNWFVPSLLNTKLLVLCTKWNKGFFITVFPSWQIFPRVWTFIMWAEIRSLL